MIRRSTIVKLVIFAVVTIVGVSYTAVHYVGIGRGLLSSKGYTAYVDMADSGGIFTSASVTYRGIEVGRVGKIQLRPDGIRVALNINGKYRIPASTRAVVGNGSAIGEQFVDLQPTTATGPYLHQGSLIPQRDSSLPVSTQTLLVNLNSLVQSVPKDDLRTVIDELGKAFDNTGPPLGRMLDASASLIDTATRELPQTVKLIDDGRIVLTTQNDLSDSIIGFSRDLATFSDQLRRSDPDLRAVLDKGVPAAQQLSGLVHDIDAPLSVVLGNLTSLGQITELRQNNIKQVLIIYPYVMASAFAAFPGDGTTRFAVPTPPPNDPACTQGFSKSIQRPTQVETTQPFPYGSFCKAPASETNVTPRGTREAPTPNGGRVGDDPSYYQDSPHANGY